MKQFKKFLMTIAVIILFVILTLTLCAGLALSSVYSDVFTASPSAELPMTVVKNALTSSACTISEEELNSFAAYLISTGENTAANDEFRLTDIYIDLSGNTPSKCYMRITNGTFTFTAAADCDILFGDDLTLRFSNITVGKLPVPDAAAARFFDDIDLGEASKYADVGALAVRFPTHYGLDVTGLGQIVDIDIESLDVDDDSIYITTNGIIGDSLKSAFDSVIDYVLPQ